MYGNGGQVRMQVGNLEEPPLPKEAADELKKQIEEKNGNGGLVDVQATSSGRGKL